MSLSDLALQIRLQSWLSPGFPIGAFSYSGGLEAAVEAGEARDGGDLRDWLETYLQDGPGRTDAIFLAQAAGAVARDDWPALEAVAELSAVFAPGAERRLETRAQGAAFLKAARAAYPWRDGAAQRLAEDRLGDEPAYPTVFGVWAAGAGAQAMLAAGLYLNAVAANLISAGVRLSLLGQTEGQRLLSGLSTIIQGLALEAAAAELDEAGGAMIRGDLASLRHETQTVRLFRT